MNKALDEVRAGESRRIASEGRVTVLKKSRWLLLKREENLKDDQRFRLRDILRYNLTVRAYLLKNPSSSLGMTTRRGFAGQERGARDMSREVVLGRRRLVYAAIAAPIGAVRRAKFGSRQCDL